MKCFAKVVAILFCLGIPHLSDAQSTVVKASTDDVGIFDYNSDDLGDLPYSATGEIEIVGENGADRFEHRYLLPFLPDAEQRAAIARAQSVALTLELWRATNVTGFQVDVYGLPNRTVVTPISSDFEAEAIVVVSGAITGERPRGSCSFDVTDFAKTEAAKGPTSVILFRLQIAPDVPNGDKLFNQYIFVSANTTTPPVLTLLQGSAPIKVTIERSGNELRISWNGGRGPYRFEKTTDLSAGNWELAETTDASSVTLANTDNRAFYRISGQ